MLDIGLLRKAIEWAEGEAARPDQTNCEWYQKFWSTSGSDLGRSCGTAYCIAGYIVSVVDGPEKARLGTAYSRMGTASSRIGHRAAELLGVQLYGEALSEDQRHGLFGSASSIKDVRLAGEALARKYGEVL